MKKILLTALSSIALCLSFVACSGDDDDSTSVVTPTPPNSEKLIGKWTYVKELALDAGGKVVSVDSLNQYYIINFGPNGVSIDSISCSSSIIDFKADGTFVETDYSYNEKKGACIPDTVNGKWSINGDTFTMENNDVEEGEESIVIFTIETLSDNVFKIDIPLSKDFASDYKPNVVKLRHVLERL
ncbi:MAG: lipocalin family protein [Flavobacteriaceae bacterium]|jgi:hypothetical protein|nr:lipocalin family protein [Flavobacteriaceae bacterium]